MTFVVAPIVEGHGDFAAVPTLIRALEPRLTVAKPVRFPKSKLVADGLQRAGSIARANVIGRGAILLVIDADDDCAAELGRTLEGRLTSSLFDVAVFAAVAVKEFEAWIVGGDPAYGVDNPDAAGGHKARIRQRFGRYSETVDQPRLIAQADVARLRQVSRSFRHFDDVVGRIRALAGLSAVS